VDRTGCRDSLASSGLRPDIPGKAPLALLRPPGRLAGSSIPFEGEEEERALEPSTSTLAGGSTAESV
jgi:hypothetical protein